jgi:glycine/D-amino acid oxidase-like deaminating enzyme
MNKDTRVSERDKSNRLTETDVLVVGGGVVGCCAAYYLARLGLDVVVIDRDGINDQASGVNAGSLHLMIVSRFFKSRDPLWIAGRNRLLPLVMASVETWRELAGELDRDIELVLDGGLMVAETDGQLRMLEEKAKEERSHGLDVEVVSGSDLRSIAPYFSERVIGAAFCPDEGKINPIMATGAVARGAERAGTRFLRSTELLALETTGDGFKALTDNGAIRCRRVVDAAGAGAATVAAMVGVRLPIETHARLMNVTEAAPPLVKHLVQHGDRMLSMKQAARGNVVIGGGWPAVFDHATGRPDVIKKSIKGNLGVARSVVPGLGPLRLLRTWGGMLTLTPDGDAILGEVPGVPGFYLAVPPNPGFTGAPICGRLLAERIAGKTSTFDLDAFSVERFAF